MVPRGAEGVFRDEPARREDDEVGDRGAGMVRGASEHSEDAGVGVVIGDAADSGEAAEVVFVGVVEAMPGDDVEGSVILGGGEEVPVPFTGYFVNIATGMVFFEGADGGLEVARVC